MRIDVHTHLDDVNNSGFSAEKNLKLLLNTMRENKIDHAMVLADIESFPNEKFLTNEELTELISPYSNLHLVGKTPLKSAQNRSYLRKVRRLLAERKILGIKIYPGYESFYPHDKRYSKVYDLCEEFDVPLMIHTGDVMQKGNLKYAAPLHVDELANKRPNLKIIICHMGNPWQLDAAAVTFKNENVYADTAGLFYGKLNSSTKIFLERKIEEFIRWNEKSEKLLFGSDWPITSMKDSINLIKDLPHFSDKERKLIFCENARKLFKI